MKDIYSNNTSSYWIEQTLLISRLAICRSHARIYVQQNLKIGKILIVFIDTTLQEVETLVKLSPYKAESNAYMKPVTTL